MPRSVVLAEPRLVSSRALEISLAFPHLNGGPRPVPRRATALHGVPIELARATRPLWDLGQMTPRARHKVFSEQTH